MHDLTPSERLHAADLITGVPSHVVIRALTAGPDDWRDPPGLGARAASAWRRALGGAAWRERWLAERAALAAGNACVVTPLDEDWPSMLPPESVLRVRGRCPVGAAVAVVGARRADAYGCDIARRVAEVAVAANVTVISGGAYGIDAAAHRAALDAGGKTVAVLGGGLAHPSPRRHLRMFTEIAISGAVVSPFPWDARPARWTFPRRNAWIAGLADDVIVVQADLRSGARHTAEGARALGRRVWAVPGSIDHPLHRGCHELIEHGAQLLARPDAWRPKSVDELPAAGEERAPSVGEALWRAAGAEPRGLAELAVDAGLSVAEAAVMATQLEIGGWLQTFPGAQFARRRGRGE